MSTMPEEISKTYVLEDIMRKRKRSEEAVLNKVRAKVILRGKRKRNEKAIMNPEKFIKDYRSAQKSYSHLRQQEKKDRQTQDSDLQAKHQLLLVIRIRGVKDISLQQKHLLNKLRLRFVNTAVFLQATPANLRILNKIENYVTWGEPNKTVISELIFKKLSASINGVRTPIKSNLQVEENIGGGIVCLQDIVHELFTLGNNFTKINEFIHPFKLTTPEGVLASRLRKPVTDNGHWGYRGEQINDYVQNMI